MAVFDFDLWFHFLSGLLAWSSAMKRRLKDDLCIYVRLIVEQLAKIRALDQFKFQFTERQTVHR